MQYLCNLFKVLTPLNIRAFFQLLALVSDLSKRLDAELEIWRNLELSEPYLYLTIDADYEKVRI